MDKVFGKSYSMVSATTKAEEQVYHKKASGGSVWYYADGKFSGNNVYVSRPGNKDGMGGRDTRFKLVNGEIDVVKGAWQSNCGQLLDETGVDLTNKIGISYVIAKGIEHTEVYQPDKYLDIVEIVEEPKEMSFKYPESRAIALAKELKSDLYLCVMTSGGKRSLVVKFDAKQ